MRTIDFKGFFFADAAYAMAPPAIEPAATQDHTAALLIAENLPLDD
jgi:hypothetical protein